MNIMIAVCSYKRLDSLRRCLNSIQIMTIPHNITMSLEIVVIDNEPSSKVSALCNSKNITYIAEPNRGLVFARNAVLKYARTKNLDYLGVIDDDETVSSLWLCDMLEAFKVLKSDAIAGIIDIKLGDEMPTYLKDAYQFKKVKNPTEVKTLPMGNVMLGQKILNSNIIFDAQFNFTGGEDVDFFYRLSQTGFKLFKIPNATVTEYLMPEKASLLAYFNRQMRVSKLHYAQKYPKFCIKYLLECGVSVFEIVGGVLLSPLFFFGDSLKVKLVKTFAKAMGRIMSRDTKIIQAYGF